MVPRPLQSPSFPSGHRTAGRRWLSRSSPLSRYALAAYLLVVVDASLYPFVGWRDLGWRPYDYLLADWPRRALPFDAAINALGYLPLGFLAGLALHPRVRGVAAIASGTLLCAIVSINLEALQTYLPSRVASKVDVLTNVAGGLLGAVLSARAARPLLDAGRLRVWRTRWFASDSSRGLLLVLAWFAALLYPDAFVLGTGGVSRAFTTAASGSLAAWLGLGDPLDPSVVLHGFRDAETAVAALAMLGAGLLFLNLMRPGLRWPVRIALLTALIAATVATATLAHAFLFDEGVDWPPLTPGARSGLIGAALCLPHRDRAAVARAVGRRSRRALRRAGVGERLSGQPVRDAGRCPVEPRQAAQFLRPHERAQSRLAVPGDPVPAAAPRDAREASAHPDRPAPARIIRGSTRPPATRSRFP